MPAAHKGEENLMAAAKGDEMEKGHRGLGVVIVDDAQALRGVLRTTLVSDGYRVLADLPSGSRLLETVERVKPHIVCLDFDLPGMDGVSLLREIHAAHPEVAVVMITGSTGKDTEKLAAEAGAAGFLRKPFSPDQILAELRQVAHAQMLLLETRKNAGEAVAQERLIQAVIADDSHTMRQLLTAILNQAGVAVLGEASNGEETLQLVKDIRPELVFLDYAMPVMNGLDALREIHRLYPEIKVMMVTAHADRDLVRQSGQAGARGYILKPYRPEKVIEAVNRLIAT